MKAVLIGVSCLIALIGVMAVVFYVIDYLQPSPDVLNLEAADREADVRILLVGNNDVYSTNLHHIIEALLEEAVPAWDDALVIRHAPADWTLELHALDMQATGHPLNAALMTGGPVLRGWDYIILAEDTPVVGYASHEPEALAGSLGATVITQAAAVNQSRVLLFAAWGYRDGDAEDRFRYPDYVTMQRYITMGYSRLATDLRARGQQATIIPVGDAFHTVYSDTAGQGGNPLAESGAFAALYADDGKRASLAGDYLAACLIVSIITGEPVSGLTYVPDGLDSAQAAYLRNMSDQIALPPAPIELSAVATYAATP